MKLYARGGNMRYVCDGPTATYIGRLVSDLFDERGRKIASTRPDSVLEIVDGTTFTATPLGATLPTGN